MKPHIFDHNKMEKNTIQQKKEDHYSLCQEPGGEYLGHITLDSKERDLNQPAAEQ